MLPSEWWTYSLGDFLLFAPDTYFRLIARYNAEVWPGQIAALSLGAVILILALRGRGRAAALLLAAAWAWSGWAFLAQRYADINWAAETAAQAFGVQAALLLLATVVGARPVPAGVPGRVVGAGLMLYALALHPLVGPALGRDWAAAELFGLMPDPTALFTLGFLVMCSGWSRWLLLPVPLLWAVAGGATLRAMEAPDAWAVFAAALVAAVAMGWSAVARRRGAG